jgi:hypothetical protein
MIPGRLHGEPFWLSTGPAMRLSPAPGLEGFANSRMASID